MERRMKIADIKVGERFRTHLGDVRGLAHSIKETGLLQAVGVRKDDNQLIFGQRRLEAVKLNGDTEIDARVLDLDDLLAAEHAENYYREDLQPTDGYALAEA